VDPCHTNASPLSSCLWRLILQHALLLAHAYGHVCGHVPPYLPLLSHQAVGFTQREYGAPGTFNTL
jgi:hypothetical protein